MSRNGGVVGCWASGVRDCTVWGEPEAKGGCRAAMDRITPAVDPTISDFRLSPSVGVVATAGVGGREQEGRIPSAQAETMAGQSTIINTTTLRTRLGESGESE